MAKPKKLKVYRTPVGFHDAYVAASSQKAALEAWGAGSNLFALGTAELVEDTGLTATALGRPGEVIKVLRGSEAEQLAALGPNRLKARKMTGKTAESKRAVRTSPKKTPRPSRAALDKAEAALEQAEKNHRDALRQLAREEEQLARRRREAERRAATEMNQLEKVRARASAEYQAAMRSWEG